LLCEVKTDFGIFLNEIAMLHIEVRKGAREKTRERSNIIYDGFFEQF